jgi:hypothetical protein
MAQPNPTADPLEDIIKGACDAFTTAKADGVLEAGEVVQIAVDVARKLQRLAGLSGSEKKAVVLLTLKKGLDAAGGVASLPGLKEASLEMQEGFECQLLAAAGAALDIAFAAAAGKIDLQKPASWKACLPACLSLAQAAVVLVPKDQQIVKDALNFALALKPAQPVEPKKESLPSAPEPVEPPAPAPVPVADQSQKEDISA